ncbi:hypothetical protein ACFL2U_02900 [Patescibacteria group bacterium]
MAEKPKITVLIKKSTVLAGEIMAYDVTVSSGDKQAEFCFLGKKTLENYVHPLKQMAENAGYEVDVIWE